MKKSGKEGWREEGRKGTERIALAIKMSGQADEVFYSSVCLCR